MRIRRVFISHTTEVDFSLFEVRPDWRAHFEIEHNGKVIKFTFPLEVTTKGTLIPQNPFWKKKTHRGGALSRARRKWFQRELEPLLGHKPTKRELSTLFGAISGAPFVSKMEVLE